MYNLVVTCKGAKALVGEFVAWHQFEQLVAIQQNETIWEWFDSLFKSIHLFELDRQHLVTTAANGMTVVYSIEPIAQSEHKPGGQITPTP